MMYGIKNAPPPFSYATYGNRQTFPNPTDKEIHDIKNSTPFDQVGRSCSSSSVFSSSDIESDLPFGL